MDAVERECPASSVGDHWEAWTGMPWQSAIPVNVRAVAEPVARVE